MAEEGLYIGLMSGTSADAIDAVLVAIGDSTIEVRAAHAEPIPDALRRSIMSLMLPGADSIDLLGETDHRLGLLFAETANNLLARESLGPAAIAAIGSHGQTVRHRPRTTAAFTLQIADPNIIAARTGITTVADFRRKDMACGGQGAPLAPAFHRAVFQHPHQHRAVVNIGGIGNITWLPPAAPVIGFDTGPGNGLMDAWSQEHLDQPFDDRGQWAASGSVHSPLLQALLSHPFLQLPPPRTTGREDFNLPWLKQVLAGLPGATPSPADVQATLAEFTAATIAGGLSSLATEPGLDEIYLCGGGVHNSHLVSRIEQAMAPIPVYSTARAGIDPGHVEGAAFAWMARQTLLGRPGALASVTGAAKDAILGGIYHS